MPKEICCFIQCKDNDGSFLCLSFLGNGTQWINISWNWIWRTENVAFLCRSFPALCYKKGSVDGGKPGEFWSPGSLALNLFSSTLPPSGESLDLSKPSFHICEAELIPPSCLSAFSRSHIFEALAGSGYSVPGHHPSWPRPARWIWEDFISTAGVCVPTFKTPALQLAFLKLAPICM